ncbi:MAG: 2-oxoacid:acceptor oxidoreductase family protein [Synergistales bacterium]|nr:2-oxoacid:acceptor oxidoreductase family protein [Synergistales bacterium]
MQYVIVGLGGQGILFSSKVLGQIALSRGERVLGSEVHGMAQRGGSVISHFKIGSYHSPLVRAGEADLLLAFEQGEGFRNLHFLRDGGMLVVNVHQKEALENEKLRSYLDSRRIGVRAIEGYEILKKEMDGRFLFLNVLILGALSATVEGGVSYDEVKQAVAELSPERFRTENLKVLALGHEALQG